LKEFRMSTGQWIVLALFAGGLGCSLTLFWWLVRSVRRDRRRDAPPHDTAG
jgi:hypothetical protein